MTQRDALLMWSAQDWLMLSCQPFNESIAELYKDLLHASCNVQNEHSQHVQVHAAEMSWLNDIRQPVQLKLAHQH